MRPKQFLKYQKNCTCMSYHTNDFCQHNFISHNHYTYSRNLCHVSAFNIVSTVN